MSSSQLRFLHLSSEASASRAGLEKDSPPASPIQILTGPTLLSIPDQTTMGTFRVLEAAGFLLMQDGAQGAEWMCQPPEDVPVESLTFWTQKTHSREKVENVN